MSVFVTRELGLDVTWAGVALGVAAALEMPALLAIARLNRRVASLHLVAAGCLVGTAYYVAMTLVSGPIIGFGSASALGYGGLFAVCAALTVGALAAMVVAGRMAPSRLSAPAAPPRRRGSPEPSSTGSAATPT